MSFIDAPLFLQQTLIIVFILAFVLAIVALFVTFILTRKSFLFILSPLTFLSSFLLVFLTMRGSYLHRVSKEVFEPSKTVLSWPLWVFVAVLLLLLALSVFEIVYSSLWNKEHISVLSVKESVDKLPSGICFFEKNGTIRLSNLKMNELAMSIMGHSLLDGARFCKDILKIDLLSDTSTSKVILVGERAYSFKLYSHTLEKKPLYELEVFDVTELHLLGKELEEKSLLLKERNKRLLSYGDRIEELTLEKELLAAKIQIHDQMGSLLLVTGKKMSENLSMKEKSELLEKWEEELKAFGRFGGEIKKKKELDVLKDVGSLIGISIHFEGEEPIQNSSEEKVFKVAIHECLTNASRHAGSKNLYVYGKYQDDKYEIILRNDGAKPKGEIVLGGGLSSLKALLIREGGTMKIYSQPEFRLVIETKKGGLA